MVEFKHALSCARGQSKTPNFGGIYSLRTSKIPATKTPLSLFFLICNSLSLCLSLNSLLFFSLRVFSHGSFGWRRRLGANLEGSALSEARPRQRPWQHLSRTGLYRLLRISSSLFPCLLCICFSKSSVSVSLSLLVFALSRRGNPVVNMFVELISSRRFKCD